MSKGRNMTTCRHCGAEIAAGAKTCPKCGGKNKKPIYKRPWFIVLILLIIFGVLGSGGGEDETETASEAQTETEPEEIVYTPYDMSELMNDLDQNPLNAADKYQNQPVELVGKLNVIDSSGQYISVVPSNDPYAILGVQCFIKTEEQKEAVKGLSIGDTITVKGEITEVGEVIGYSLDIDEIGK